jgi:uncharacterized ubiquitin-like protein YukD
MPDRLFVTVGSHTRKDRVFLEMPMDKAVRQIIPDLIKVLDWKEIAWESRFALSTEDGRVLPATCSLAECGVRNSDVLFILPSPPDPPGKDLGNTSSNEEKGEADPYSTDWKLARNIFSQPHFIGPTGELLLLGNPPLTIGRAGKEQKTDIDLSPWDARMIASRRHAVVDKAGDRYTLKAEKTTNGTFLNGEEMAAGEIQSLNDGDRICFGFRGVELVFRNPQVPEIPSA